MVVNRTKHLARPTVNKHKDEADAVVVLAVDREVLEAADRVAEDLVAVVDDLVVDGLAVAEDLMLQQSSMG